ncbi:hypothetical protein C0389_00720 [bacterium]|nr:hypothetical protein [bacterium]
MPVKTYSAIAEIYAHMMRSIDYKEWADYILEISREVKKKNLSVLELAGGTGAIASLLCTKMKIVSSDISYAMLKKNKDGAVPKICCDMVRLPFKKRFDFIFSTFDSVNYLNTKEKFISYLNSAEGCIVDDGILAFDVSLENNSKKFEKYLNRRGKIDGITFQQRSFYNRTTRIHYNHFDITLADGKKVEEIHKQKIYRFEEYFDFIDRSRFYVHKCYKAFTFKNADAETERAQFILKKKNHANI